MDHQEKQRLVIENETLRAGYDAARLEINHFRGVTKMVAPAQPVAWLVYLPSEDAQRIYDSQDDIGYVDDLTNNADAKVSPLYTAQPSAAAAAQPPAGWVLVPVEPTVSMRDAMWIETGMRFSETRLAYSAMLAAAPKAAPVAQGDAEDAARYRWLRARWGRIADEYDGDSDQLVAIRESDSHFEGWDVGPVSLDRAIDAARSQAKEGAIHE